SPVSEAASAASGPQSRRTLMACSPAFVFTRGAESVRFARCQPGRSALRNPAGIAGRTMPLSPGGASGPPRCLVQAAHQQGLYVILDIIAHPTGNVFTYAPDRYPTSDPATGRVYNDPRWDDKPYPVQGLNDSAGRPTLPFESPEDARLEAAWPDGAIW